jgi:hypothetical protein
MAGKLKMNESQEQTHSSSTKWIDMINRGGLYHVDDAVYNFFVAMEYLVDEKLSKIFEQSGKAIYQEIKGICLGYVTMRKYNFCGVLSVHVQLKRTVFGNLYYMT